MNVLERLEKKFTGAANKAPYLYRFLKGKKKYFYKNILIEFSLKKK